MLLSFLLLSEILGWEYPNQTTLFRWEHSDSVLSPRSRSEFVQSLTSREFCFYYYKFVCFARIFVIQEVNSDGA